MNIRLCILLPAAFALSCAPSGPEPMGLATNALFASGSDMPIGAVQETTTVLWGDADGDGFLELVALNGLNSAEADVSSEFDPATSLMGPVASLPGAAMQSFDGAFGDTDGDGIPNLVVGTPGGWVVHSATGPTLFSQNGSIRSLEFGDCDGDGVLELALGGNTTMAVEEANGLQSLWADSTLVGYVVDLAWADFDADGDLDLAGFTSAVGALVVWRNDGACTFTSLGSAGFSGVVTALEWGNTTANSNPELFLGIGSNGSVESYRWSSTAGQFNLVGAYGTCAGGQVVDMALMDADVDGNADIAVACDGANDSLLRGDGGTFSQEGGGGYALSSSVAPGSPASDGPAALAVGRGGTSNQLWAPESGGLTPQPLPLNWIQGDPNAVTWIDQDQDGLLELVVGSSDGALWVWTDPQTNPSANAIRAPGTAAPVATVQSGQFDTSPLLDLLVTRMGPNGAIEIEVGDAIAPFGYSGPFPVSAPEKRAVVGWDAGCDGVLDIVDGDGEVFVYTGNGATYASASTLSFPIANAMVVADVSSPPDGEVEVLVSTPTSGHVLASCSDAAFSTSSWPAIANASSLAAGDFDGDGSTDIGAAFVGGQLGVFLAPTIGSAVTWTGPPGPSGVSAGDWDGDGRDELAATYSDGTLRMYGWNGSTMAELWMVPADARIPAAGQSLAWGDYDRDGDLDLAMLANFGPVIYENHRRGTDFLMDNPTWLGGVTVDGIRTMGSQVATPLVSSSTGDVELTVRVVDAESTPVGEILWEAYELGSGWVPIAVTGPAGPFASSPAGTEAGPFVWAPAGGLVDQVVRVRARLAVQNPSWVSRSIPQGQVYAASGVFRADIGVAAGDDDDSAGDDDDSAGDDDDSVGDDDDSVGDDDDSVGDDDDSVGDDDDSTLVPPAVVGSPDVDDDGDGWTELEGDCDDANPAVGPEGGCDVCFQDVDGDFQGSQVMVWIPSSWGCIPLGHSPVNIDCDDTDPTVGVGQPEICDLIDQNCDGILGFDTDGDGVPNCTGAAVSCGVDADGDGVGVAPGENEEPLPAIGGTCPAGYAPFGPVPDCDDQDALISPLLPELCDGGTIDNDCDGSAEDPPDDLPLLLFYDGDGDGFGTLEVEVPCSEAGDYSPYPGDCDDSDPTVHPGADEGATADGIDSDCDGFDTACFQDLDEDGWGGATLPISPAQCTGDGLVTVGGDCNDTESLQHPSLEGQELEICDLEPGRDWDCDGTIDLGDGDPVDWRWDRDEDGYGDASDEGLHPASPMCSHPPEGSGLVGVPVGSEDVAAQLLDCDDDRAATHPGAPEVCNGLDDDCDSDTDGGDPGAPEVCNGVDDNCNGLADEGFPDGDLDGFAWCGGEVADCDDADGGIHPGATELCTDAVDQDCDGTEAATGDDPDCWATGCMSCASDINGARSGWAWLAILALLPGLARRRRGTRGPTPVLVLLLATLVLPAGTALAQTQDFAAMKDAADALRQEGKMRDALLAYRAYLDAGGPPTAVIAPWRALEAEFGTVRVELSGSDPSWTAHATLRWDDGEATASGAPGELVELDPVPVGVQLSLEVSGDGLERESRRVIPLVSGDLPHTEAVALAFAGFGTLEVQSFESSAAEVFVHDGSTWRSALPGTSIAVTAGAVPVRMTNASGTTEVFIDVGAQESVAFDPVAWIPVTLTLAGVPAGATLSVFVENAQRVVSAELVASADAGAIDGETGLQLIDELTLDSVVPGVAGIYLQHPALGTGAWNVDITPSDGARLVIDPSSLPGTSRITADYQRWSAARSTIRRRTVAGMVSGGSVIVLGSIGSGLLWSAAVRASGRVNALREEAQVVGVSDLAQLQSLQDQHRKARTEEGLAVAGAALSTIAAGAAVGVVIALPLESRAAARELGPWRPWP